MPIRCADRIVGAQAAPVPAHPRCCRREHDRSCGGERRFLAQELGIGSLGILQNAATFGRTTTDLFSLRPQALEVFDTKFETGQPVMLSLAPSPIRSDLRKIFAFDYRLFDELSKAGWDAALVPWTYWRTGRSPAPSCGLRLAGDQIPRRDLWLQADRGLLGRTSRPGWRLPARTARLFRGQGLKFPAFPAREAPWSLATILQEVTPRY